jgi:DNA-binding MarR family transcriptional regulator
MDKTAASQLRNRVIAAARSYGISNVLFRNVIAERLGLNVTDLECLGLLFQKRLSTPSELSRHTGLTSGATTAMLDRLERSGLIRRRPNPADRRGTIIELEPSGAETVGPWFNSARNAQARLVSEFSERELGTIADFLEGMAQMWDDERLRLQQDRTARRDPGQTK